jgi:hypothetical protein
MFLRNVSNSTGQGFARGHGVMSWVSHVLKDLLTAVLSDREECQLQQKALVQTDVLKQ